MPWYEKVRVRRGRWTLWQSFCCALGPQHTSVSNFNTIGQCAWVDDDLANFRYESAYFSNRFLVKFILRIRTETGSSELPGNILTSPLDCSDRDFLTEIKFVDQTTFPGVFTGQIENLPYFYFRSLWPNYLERVSHVALRQVLPRWESVNVAVHDL